MNKHPGGKLKVIEFDSKTNMSPYVVEDIVTSFQRIDRFGQANYINAADFFEEDSTKYKVIIGNHFQGCARHRNGRYFYISGDDKGVGSHLFIAKVESHLSYKGSRSAKGPIRSNLINNRRGSEKDSLLDLFIIDKTLYHAGGISLMGDILVVSLESKDKEYGKIAFIDVTKPESPALLKAHIRIKGNAGSAACIRLSNGHFLTASWTEDTGRHFNFYLSKTKGLSEFSKPVRFDIADAIGFDKDESPRFQAIQFVKEKGGGLYIIGSDSRKKSGGQSRWFLLKVELDKTTLKKNGPALVKPKITFVKTVFPHKGYTYYNFNTCGGVYVDNKNRLSIYGGGKSRGGEKGKYMKLCEFYERLSKKEEQDIKEGIIELYTEPNFQGRSLVIDLSIHNDIPNYHKVEVPGPTIDDKVRSMRYILPKGKVYTFYHDSNYNKKDNGKVDTKKNTLSLKGTGKLELIANIKDATPKKLRISSSQ